MTAAVEIPNGGYNPGMGTYSVSPEVDVYRDPHLRMKQVINSTIDQIKCVDIFSLDDILQSVYISMWELKSHELIENRVIMDRLRDRLDSQKVYNKQVCNCHEDSSLVNIIELVEQVYAADNNNDRRRKLQLLQAEVQECLSDMMPHMEEEENVFLPLLTEYFDYVELKEIKKKVVEQHKLWKDRLEFQKTKLKDIENEERRTLYFETKELEIFERENSYCRKLAELELDASNELHEETKVLEVDTQDELIEEISPVNKLADEVLIEIFMLLNPRELARAAGVSRRWNQIVKDKGLWKNLLAAQWVRGIWSFKEVELMDKDIAKIVQGRVNELEDTANRPFYEDTDSDDASGTDEDNALEAATISERIFSGLIQNLLPEIGTGVRKLIVSGNSTISSQQLRKMIKLCPALEVLDCSYTDIGDSAFKGISNEGSLSELRKLDLTGCVHISNISVERISSCFITKQETTTPKVSWISVSGCKLLTDKIFGYLEVFKVSLEELDMSGCSRISGTRMKLFAKRCSLLLPENLSYCDLIEDGPYEDQANGCQNVDCPLRECCMTQKN